MDPAELSNVGISVVMPVQNAGHYLATAVGSILEQTHQNLELLIVDDHSSDNAIEQLFNAVKDVRLRVLSSPGTGIIDALNFGIAQSKYDIIARMDGDDIAAPHRLQTQLRFLQAHPEIEFVGASVNLFKDSDRLGKGYTLYEKWINGLCEHDRIVEQFFVESTIPHPTALFRRSSIKQLGGYKDHGWPEDYDLWCRALLAGYRFGKPSGAPLLHWRDHTNRASRQDLRYAKQKFLQCKAYYLAQYLSDHLERRYCTIWGTGPTGLKLHDYLEENGISVESFIDISPKLEGRTKRTKSVKVIRDFKQLEPPSKAQAICLVAVSARGAREEMIALFKRSGWQQGRHYLLVA